MIFTSVVIVLFSLIIVSFLNAKFKNEISFLNVIEILTLSSILFLTYYYELDDFYFLYVFLLMIAVTQLWLRKKEFSVYNSVITTALTAFVLTQMTRYSFNMLVTEQVLNVSVSLEVITTVTIVFGSILLYLVNNFHKRLFSTSSPLIDIGVITFNVVIFILILFANILLLYPNLEIGNVNTILFLVFFLIALVIMFGYVGVLSLEKSHIENVILMNDKKAVNARSSIAYRKNHNTTNIFITVNHLLKVKQYDELHKYINEINKGDSQ